MDKTSERRKRDILQRHRTEAEARARGLLPCGCREVAYGSREHRRHGLGFRKGAAAPWCVVMMLVSRACSEHWDA